jgi:parvulin-like peptidyl-prolyl isomerase
MAQQYVNSMLKETGRRASLAEIQDYYEAHPNDYRTPDRVKWLHIFIAFGIPPNQSAAAARMAAIQKRIAAGEDFAALSQKFDEGLAARQKGFGTGERRTGSESKKEDWIQPPDIESTVWALKPGEVSAVIQSPTGYHLVKVVEREYAGMRPLDQKLQGEIRNKINEALYIADEAKLVKDLWRRGVVQVIDE